MVINYTITLVQLDNILPLLTQVEMGKCWNNSFTLFAMVNVQSLFLFLPLSFVAGMGDYATQIPCSTLCCRNHQKCTVEL